MGKISNASSRRLRTPNWSLAEKQYLLELIKPRKDVVVPKNNNGPNYSEEKDTAWNEILRELAVKFGSKFNTSSIKKVKTQWQNMKRVAREEITLNGPALHKLSKQSIEVCNILDMIKDGVLKTEGQNLNDTILLAGSNVEIKTERIDEDLNQPSCSGINNARLNIECQNYNQHQNNINANQNNLINVNQLESSASSASEHVSETNDYDQEDAMESGSLNTKLNSSVMTMTDETFVKQSEQVINPFRKEMQDYFTFLATEKIIKLESLKEERHVVRAMRETAELNKIIAEQKLKHVLWIKKQEMSMYSGELGSGAGKGGGGGGSIREAGGSFGKMEAAREDEYFYKKQKEQLKNMKTHLDKEINFHEQQIKLHEDAIRRHKTQKTELDKNE